MDWKWTQTPPTNLDNWIILGENIKILFLTILSVLNSEGCWVNRNGDSNQVVLMPMMSQIKPYTAMTSATYIKHFFQLSSQPCPGTQIWAKIVPWIPLPCQFVYSGTKLSIIVGKCFPEPPNFTIILGWSLQSHKLGSPFGQCKNTFYTIIFISKNEGCWVNCQCWAKSSHIDAHVDSNQAT